MIALVPGPIGGDDARRLAEQELSRPEYRQGDGSWAQRILDRIGQFLDSIAGSGGSTLVLGIVGAIVLAVVVFAVVRAGKVPGRRRREPTDADPLATTPGVDHAAEAQRLQAAGAHAQAVREYLRAAVAELERRGVLMARPGRTGAGAAAEGGDALPATREPLLAGAQVFDETWFGGRPATAADVETARRAHEAVRDAARGAVRS